MISDTVPCQNSLIMCFLFAAPWTAIDSVLQGCVCTNQRLNKQLGILMAGFWIVASSLCYFHPIRSRGSLLWGEIGGFAWILDLPVSSL